jgi:hypothetical protein
VLAAGLLLEDEHVNDACVVGVADELTGEVPIAFVVLSDPSYDPKLLRKCFQTVASYKKPREFIVIDKVREGPRLSVRRGCAAVRLCGCAAAWLCCFAAVRLCGCATLCGCAVGYRTFSPPPRSACAAGSKVGVGQDSPPRAA